MQALINKKTYDTEDAIKLGCRSVGVFGQSFGYEEQLFVTKSGQHFIYGVGGPDSLYVDPEITLITSGEAEIWKKDNGVC